MTERTPDPQDDFWRRLTEHRPPAQPHHTPPLTSDTRYEVAAQVDQIGPNDPRYRAIVAALDPVGFGYKLSEEPDPGLGVVIERDLDLPLSQALSATIWVGRWRLDLGWLELSDESVRLFSGRQLTAAGVIVGYLTALGWALWRDLREEG